MALRKEELTFTNCEMALQLELVQVAYAFCPDCDHRICENCEEFSYAGEDVSQFFSEGFDIKSFPPEMWDRVDQCCSCGSQNHVIEWLRKVWHPVAYRNLSMK